MRDWLERFVDDGTIGESQLEEARSMAANLGIPCEDALIRLGYISSGDLMRAQAEEFGYDYIELEGRQIPNSIIELVTESMARENVVIPIESDGESVVIAMHNPNNIEIIDKLRFVLNREIRPVMAPLESIQAAINRHYGQSETESVDSMISEFTETQIDFTDVEAASAMQDDEDDSAPIIRLANLIISEAVKERASDIHVEPFEDRVRIRYRIDGVLIERDSPPKRLLGALVSRFKIMAKMDISEKRRPQDGRIKTRAGTKEFDLRVSILPTNHGQAVVMRILDRDNIKVGIRNLGFGDDNYRTFQNIIRRPNGIFLVTGPTGSGKTTTLYSALGELNRPDRKIITAEDPVEYYLPGINQVQVHDKIDLTFARVLRSALRQDPDVILVGEMRDAETAEIGLRAAITGHLVLSTLHTNDAPQTLTRLVDMGVKPYAIATSVSLIIAQRLARRLCSHCKTPIDVPRDALIQEGFVAAEVQGGLRIYGPKGCPNCTDGYKGRVGIYQVMAVTEAIGRIIMEGGNAISIADQARKEGVLDLRASGLNKVKEGLTSLEEVNRVTVE